MVAVVGAIGILHPRRQTGGFVVEEQAAELNGRLAVGVRTFLNISLGVLCHGSVSPPVPRRHTQLTAQLIDTIDGAAAVRAGNVQTVANGGDDEFLAFALQIGQFQAVNLLVLS